MENLIQVKCILLIDDNDDDCFIFRKIIDDMAPSITLITALDSKEAFSLLENCRPDLIFLDINLPGTNGLECLKMLKDHRFEQIPVVMYSSSANPKDVTLSYDLGASLYLRKDISADRLATALQSILSMQWYTPEMMASRFQKPDRSHSFILSH